LVLEAHDDVIGVAHHDDLTLGMFLAPLIGPQVERIVEIRSSFELAVELLHQQLDAMIRANGPNAVRIVLEQAATEEVYEC
jgi:hypothetical protein